MYSYCRAKAAPAFLRGEHFRGHGMFGDLGSKICVIIGVIFPARIRFLFTRTLCLIDIPPMRALLFAFGVFNSP